MRGGGGGMKMIREQEWERGTWVVGKKRKEKRKKEREKKKIHGWWGKKKEKRKKVGGGISYGSTERERERNRMGKEGILGVVKKIKK